MVSGVMIGGIVTAFIVCMVLVLGAFVTYFRKRGNVQGTLFVLLLGMIGVIFTQNIADVIAAVIRLPLLMEQSYLLAMIIYAILIALIDMLLRIYFVGFMSRSGMGKVRGTVFACGYVSGQCLMPMMTLFMYITYAHMINQGIFLEGLEIGTEAFELAAGFQNNLINAPAMMYYTASIEYIARAVLYTFVTMAWVRAVLEDKKGKSFGVLFGIRAVYEMLHQLIYALCTEGGGAVYTESTSLAISLVFSVLVIVAGVYAWKKVITGFPVGREPQNKVIKKNTAADDAQRKKNLAWQEVRNMNRPTNMIKKENVPAETKAEEMVRAEAETGEEP